MEKLFLLLFLIILSVFVVNGDGNGIWHFAQDIHGGIFGSDEIGITNYTFQNNVFFEEDISLNNIVALDDNGLGLKTNEGIQRLFIADNGNIGIGNSDPFVRLDVNGDIRIRTKVDCPFTYTDFNGIVKCGSVGKELNFSNGVLSLNQTYLNEILGGLGGGSLYSGFLANDVHTTEQCKGANGIVYEANESGTKVYFCKFSANSCPIGWNKYDDWTATTSNYCQSNYWASNGFGCVLKQSYCNSGVHAFSNKIIESCSYYSGGRCVNLNAGPRVSDVRSVNCNSLVIEIGCY